MCMLMGRWRKGLKRRGCGWKTLHSIQATRPSPDPTLSPPHAHCDPPLPYPFGAPTASPIPPPPTTITAPRRLDPTNANGSGIVSVSVALSRWPIRTTHTTMIAPRWRLSRRWGWTSTRPFMPTRPRYQDHHHKRRRTWLASRIYSRGPSTSLIISVYVVSIYNHTYLLYKSIKASLFEYPCVVH